MKKSLEVLFTSIGLVLLVFQMRAQPINFDWVRRFIPSSQFLKTAFLFAFFCVCCGIQAQDFVYAKGLGGTDYDLGRSIATDASGNAFVTGYFRGTVDFDPSANTANLSSSGNSSEVFLAKYNPSGDYIYAIGFGGNNSVRLYNFTGKLVFEKGYDSEKSVEINLEKLPKGVYIVEVEEIGYQITTTKVVKQ